MNDLFSFGNEKKQKSKDTYTAQDIEVLEGLEPVRKRPGMYIGGTDEAAMHHLVSEILDNAMDEAVAGFANLITIELSQNHYIKISDNGRGIPVDNHPKFPDKSALEVIMTTLHSGGKFSNNVYQTAGGLHGVGISVVNALSDYAEINIYKQGKLYTQKYSKGIALTKIEAFDAPKKLQGTQITFHPDPEIFGENLTFKPARIYELAKSKAYLFKGVKIKWQCPEELIKSGQNIPIEDIICFPNGLVDYLNSKIDQEKVIGKQIFANSNVSQENIKLEWAVVWHEEEGFIQSYCNTIPTPQGGTHEQGFKTALFKSFKIYGEMVHNKKISLLTIEDILSSSCIVISVFINDPQFQGQTKEKLVTNGISKIIENIVKDHFDYWLSSNKVLANQILDYLISVAEFRISKRSEKNIARKTLVQKLKLPGKLTDCSRTNAEGTELFIVEGDSAGGSAKQARNRETQAVLPLRGKILNVANSTIEKIAANQEIEDLEIALACGSLQNYDSKNLRYEKVIIMTDADVDGAHIASLLMTFFYLRMPQLILDGHLHIARPPLYRLTQNNKTYYASSDTHKVTLLKKINKESKAKVEVGRFKGLGEMTASQLKETTMEPKNRLLYKVTIDDANSAANIVESLMGKKSDKRFEFVQSQLQIKINEIINNLDI